MRLTRLQLIRMLGAKSLKVYQSRMAGLEALAMIASHNGLEDLRPDSKSALLKLIVEVLQRTTICS